MYDAAPYGGSMWILPCKNGEGGGSDCEGIGEDGIVVRQPLQNGRAIESGEC